ncbi:enoyl-CoA hydratase/isomerase family protein [Bradyrhizobium neotropicale]|uniref:enoyl-CoA hydratase/isomerase family protein n=1 Tax=Bradyrhizobium neotropicale TaxID=1497615 RepID=UPI001AD7D069|nr:enoyl-CoA hydratase-related protein [Bradyrhizobium neotropicale]MBO4225288.1 enoyl-CoA hydratase [Bradyrhizobium neotropicale]
MAAPILLDRKGAVAYLTLNRPDAGNAIDAPLARCLLEAVEAVEADPAIRCVVVRASGRMFCAGGDVKALHAAGDALPELLREILEFLHPAVARLAKMEKPVVSAILGPAAGAGIGLAAVGDIVLAEPDAHFTMAYSRIGLTPDGGATWLLPRHVGLRRAQELYLTNRRVSADEAAAMGLITRVVAEGTLVHEVDTLAEALASSAVGALGRTKRLLLTSGDATLAEQLEAESENIAQQGMTVEGRTGIAAFVERRQANFGAAELSMTANAPRRT